MNRENSSNVIRALAGGYLLYLAYQMITSLRAGEVDHKWVIIAATVLFIVAGAGILYYGIKGMIQQGQMNEDEVVEENLNEELESGAEMYDMYATPGLKEGKQKSIEQELDKIKSEEVKDILANKDEAKGSKNSKE